MQTAEPLDEVPSSHWDQNCLWSEIRPISLLLVEKYHDTTLCAASFIIENPVRIHNVMNMSWTTLAPAEQRSCCHTDFFFFLTFMFIPFISQICASSLLCPCRGTPVQLICTQKGKKGLSFRFYKVRYPSAACFSQQLEPQATSQQKKTPFGHVFAALVFIPNTSQNHYIPIYFE